MSGTFPLSDVGCHKKNVKKKKKKKKKKIINIKMINVFMSLK